MKKYAFAFVLFAALCSSPIVADNQTPAHSSSTAPDQSLNPPQTTPKIETLPKTQSKPQTTHTLFEDEIKEADGKDNDHFMAEFMNMLTTLGLIIVLILIVTWILKRLLNTRIQQINEASPIKILERRALTPKTAIYLLEVRGKHLIIAESHNGVTALGSVQDEPQQEVAAEPSQPNFGKVLQDKMKGQ